VVSLNTLLGDVMKLLQRLIGEDIESCRCRQTRPSGWRRSIGQFGRPSSTWQ
jgi:hypothetical protein